MTSTESLVQEFKRTGKFDDIRRQILEDFSSSSAGHNLYEALSNVAAQTTSKSQSDLIDKLRQADLFHHFERTLEREFLSTTEFKDGLKGKLNEMYDSLNQTVYTKSLEKPDVKFDVLDSVMISPFTSRDTLSSDKNCENNHIQNSKFADHSFESEFSIVDSIIDKSPSNLSLDTHVIKGIDQSTNSLNLKDVLDNVVPATETFAIVDSLDLQDVFLENDIPATEIHPEIDNTSDSIGLYIAVKNVEATVPPIQKNQCTESPEKDHVNSEILSAETMAMIEKLERNFKKKQDKESKMNNLNFVESDIAVENIEAAEPLIRNQCTESPEKDRVNSETLSAETMAMIEKLERNFKKKQDKESKMNNLNFVESDIAVENIEAAEPLIRNQCTESPEKDRVNSEILSAETITKFEKNQGRPSKKSKMNRIEFLVEPKYITGTILPVLISKNNKEVCHMAKIQSYNTNSENDKCTPSKWKIEESKLISISIKAVYIVGQNVWALYVDGETDFLSWELYSAKVVGLSKSLEEIDRKITVRYNDGEICSINLDQLVAQ